MRLPYLFIFLATLLYSHTIFAAPEACIINSLLKMGSRGVEVECLQKKIGVLADGRFGPLTYASVKVFQSNNGLVADGIVGRLSRSVFNGVVANSSASGPLPSVAPITPAVATPTISKIQTPKVFSVFPEKVRSGDTVKIYGENFSSALNTVRLRYGQIEARFENLPSSDGKVISFIFQPPEVKTMNKEELLNLPPSVLNKILDPVKAVGGSIDDIVAPYRNMKDENDLRQLLSNNGHSFEELYDKFYVTIENVSGRGSSDKAILSGLRKLSFGPDVLTTGKGNSFFVIDFLRELFEPKKAYAQLPEGGYNSGIIMYCTCGSGYLTTMTDLSSNGGSGLYWWSPGFVPTVGTPFISGPQLGYFIQSGGTCVIGVAPYCTTTIANVASLPWGEGL